MFMLSAYKGLFQMCMYRDLKIQNYYATLHGMLSFAGKHEVSWKVISTHCYFSWAGSHNEAFTPVHPQYGCG